MKKSCSTLKKGTEHDSQETLLDISEQLAANSEPLDSMIPRLGHFQLNPGTGVLVRILVVEWGGRRIIDIPVSSGILFRLSAKILTVSLKAEKLAPLPSELSFSVDV